MAFATIRKEEPEDMTAANKAARRFIDRHEIKVGRWDLGKNGDCYYAALDAYFSYKLHDGQDWDIQNTKQEHRLWLRCFNRALSTKDANGFGWGYIGKYSKD